MSSQIILIKVTQPSGTILIPRIVMVQEKK